MGAGELVSRKPKILLMDANVIIDYQNVEFLEAIHLTNMHLGEVCILDYVLNKWDFS